MFSLLFALLVSAKSRSFIDFGASHSTSGYVYLDWNPEGHESDDEEKTYAYVDFQADEDEKEEQVNTYVDFPG